MSSLTFMALLTLQSWLVVTIFRDQIIQKISFFSCGMCMMRMSIVDYVAAMIMVPVVFIISLGHLGSTYVYSMEILFCSDVVEKLRY